MASALRRGRVVWVEMNDPQGRNRKVRPAVVVTPTGEITPGGVIVVAAVTTQIGMAPASATVSLPWHGDRKQSPTGLTERSECVCDCLEAVPMADVRGTGGLVPFRQLSQILEKIAALRQPPAAASPSPPLNHADPPPDPAPAG